MFLNPKERIVSDDAEILDFANNDASFRLLAAMALAFNWATAIGSRDVDAVEVFEAAFLPRTKGRLKDLVGRHHGGIRLEINWCRWYWRVDSS
ncbi:uncharacterized protein MYCFIDRAFT_207118 [Pseudocercospora fijiensis CIRAD86]|uniref:Uncharacterized protein n=1 Tax=Pseudocercospora fijiensis (strain CIRAD86) TaxID=383855 RepID=M2ZYE8_PSEFD|nr:uncharacterized protein MYCFIDRAFT_207118 [Pseudocercospora fijiensis CIRAD86]EME83974.1 hypothetical protein MYCFIDRAFT_207118 [Pseudocercospora fijiensis CIRAD86]